MNRCLILGYFFVLLHILEERGQKQVPFFNGFFLIWPDKEDKDDKIRHGTSRIKSKGISRRKDRGPR